LTSRVESLIKNFSYSFTSNLLVLVISTIVVLIVPKALGIEQYGYWQLYILYTSYTALLHFGWNDGIYLRYGGKEYQKLDKGLFFSQFWMLVLFETIITLSAIFLSGFFVSATDRLFVIRMMVLCSLLVIPRGMLIFVLQGTNRIKEYAIATIIEKIVYVTLISFFLFIGGNNYRLMIIADIVGKGISFVYVVVICKDIVFRKFNSFYISINETLENIKVGLSVAFAYIASTLIVGTVRFGIEYSWDIATFGKVSLTLSISNMMMTFINAVGLIMFPILRRTESDRLPKIYTTLRTFLTVPLLGLITFYYPLSFLLSGWLPQYRESLTYMALIFPLCLFEGKMGLLLNTYLKTLRKEKMLMVINVVSFGLSVILTYFLAFYINNITLTVLSILVLLAFRCIFAEFYISKVLKISVKSDIAMELILTIIFVISNWFIGSWKGIVIYIIAYSIYIFIKRRNILNAVKKVISLMRH
jgi:O-antigen/teichoic acid export membrane protein